MRTRVTLWLVLALLVAAALWLPVQPAYASSDSMAPAIEAGDLYFVLEGGPVHAGDVITFEAPTHPGLVTHRVVGETAAGYVTKGDANPSTDQRAGLPAVSRSAVVGPVLAVNGRPVALPGLGAVLAAPASRWLTLLTLGALLAAALVVGIRPARSTAPQRRVVYVRDVLRPLFVGGLLVCVLFVFWGASTHGLTYVAAEGSPTATHTVPVGEPATRTVAVEAHHLPFTTVLIEAHGVAVLDRTATASGAELVVEVPSRDTPGVYHATIDVSTYPATLPRGVIERLHGLHWLAATLGTVLPVYLPVYLLSAAVADGGMPLRWPLDRWLRRVGGF